MSDERANYSKEFLEINDQDAYGTITIPDSGYNENRALNRKGIRCLLAGMFPTVPINSNNIGNFIFWIAFIVLFPLVITCIIKFNDNKLFTNIRY